MKHQQTSYSYRRYIALVHTIAAGDDNAVRALCKAWGTLVYTITDNRIDYGSTFRELAKAVIEHHGAEEREAKE